ncbi:hypothetical protein [Candidatus Cyanaurora vandensis]|uniref:hypothetical protein n=1 Tax=Candidatus Cyanaurora vandensis TaxID=2714958 RepID=UPI00257EFC12|nr:hypothetical protein [Candidatus Cyanaurora vandensis]
MHHQLSSTGLAQGTYVVPKPSNGLGKIALGICLGLLLPSCTAQFVPVAHAADETARPAFINKVWQVSKSSSTAPGLLYVFLSDGTLVLASPNSKPALGKWKHADGSLTIIEEGISYPVDILKLSKDELKIKIKGPGEPIESTLVPAEEPLPLPSDNAGL